MGKKNKRIAYLEAEVNELNELRCTNETLQLAKYCSEIEKVVNNPKFKPGSLKLIPRVSQSPSYHEVASDVEIAISALYHADAIPDEPLPPPSNTSSHVDEKATHQQEESMSWGECWKKIGHDGEILSLKVDNALLRNLVLVLESRLNRCRKMLK